MNKRIPVILTAVVFLLLSVSIAGAQQVPQVLLPGALIPKFVDPLPVAGDIKVVNATSLPIPGLNEQLNETPFPVNATEFLSQILPSTGVPLAVPPIPANNPSWVWGYRTESVVDLNDVRPSYLGPVVVAERGVAANPTYGNKLPQNGESMVQANLPIDLTLDWADPLGVTGPVGCAPDVAGNYNNPDCGLLPWTGPIPIVTHLHGGEVSPAFDGGPDAWFTQGNAYKGIGYPVARLNHPEGTYNYPNNQQESTIWFHDHALGITRLNVYAGLAGLYPIIDPANPPPTTMPKFPEYDIPLILQDRSFDTTGQLFYNLASNPQPNPTVHPFWIPEFIGDTIVVNGKTWPYLNVEPRQYRFRFVNGSNARFYDLTLNKGLKFIAIATDDGYLTNAVSTPNLIIAPGERYEVIVDFSKLKPNTNVTMFNAARTPFPGGGKVVAGVTDTVMQFRVNLPLLSNVTNTTVAAGSLLRSATNPIQPIITAHDPATGSITRQLTLNEVIGAGGPLELVVNNSKFNLGLNTPGCPEPNTSCRETELPAVGDTEIWEIINITADAHPMHLHLVSFQILDRTPFQAAKWINQYDALLLAAGKLPGEGPPNPYNVKNADRAIGGNPAIGPFLQLLNRTLPLPYEAGWKDTVITYPGEVTRIVVRWAPTDLPPTPYDPLNPPKNQYLGFDPTELSGGVGYVWHCHIIDHEDNEMMRNYVVGTGRQPVQ